MDSNKRHTTTTTTSEQETSGRTKKWSQEAVASGRKNRVVARLQQAHGFLAPSFVIRAPPGESDREPGGDLHPGGALGSGGYGALDPSRRALSNYDLASVFEESDFLGLEIPEQMRKKKEDHQARVRRYSKYRKYRRYRKYMKYRKIGSIGGIGSH
jgi:hypothetical protein